MPDTEERDLRLAQRNIETRDRRPNRTKQFDLEDIFNRFTNNIASIKSQFTLVEKLKAENNLQYKDVLRSQIVFLDSAFDFYMHEVTKYGMMQIFQNKWKKTDKYNNFTIRLGDISDALQYPEQERWLLDIVNDSYAEDTFMSAEAVIGQLKLIGIKWQEVAKKAFYEQGSTNPTNEKFKSVLKSLFKRRNQIAHQADCRHETGEKIDIERDDVEAYIDDVEKIATAIFDEIEAVNNL